MIGKARTHRGRQRRRISCFLLFSKIDILISFSLFWNVPYYRAPSTVQWGTWRSRSRSLARCCISILGPSLAPVSGQSKGKETRLRNYSPVAHLPYPRRTRCNMHLAFLSVHLLSSFLRFQRCRYLVSYFGAIPTTTFARKDERKTGQDTLILNHLRNLSRSFILSFFPCFLKSNISCMPITSLSWMALWHYS
jgi:hypothetical protein